MISYITFDFERFLWREEYGRKSDLDISESG